MLPFSCVFLKLNFILLLILSGYFTFDFFPKANMTVVFKKASSSFFFF